MTAAARTRGRRRRKPCAGWREEGEQEDSGGSLLRDFLLGFFLQFRDEILLIVATTVAAFVRAMGVTVESGQTGLLFTMGRARRELAPGFHLLVPFLQRASKAPTRSRTLDLPAQRVATFAGLVYHVDANLVYRIVDVRKALIEIDDLEKGMQQMLGLGVQEVVRASARENLSRPGKLDEELARNLARRLAPWGVQVERAGLPSITPSRQTLRITQIRRVTGERNTMFEFLAGETGESNALGLIGARTRLVRRHLHHRALETNGRRTRKLRTALMRRGWMAVQIKGAAVRLRSRATAGGKLKADGKDRRARSDGLGNPGLHGPAGLPERERASERTPRRTKRPAPPQRDRRTLRNAPPGSPERKRLARVRG